MEQGAPQVNTARHLMNKLFPGLFFLIWFYGCITPATNSYSIRWDEYYRQNVNNLSDSERLFNEQTSLINSKTSDFDALQAHISRADAVRADQQNQCAWAHGTRSYIDCLTNLGLIAGKTADLELITADYFAQKGKKDQAKAMYRRVITTYVGDAYRSYVKRAEFGLEDLK
ncbi:MAG TPA: hypothetical protein DD713_02275 [Nitrospiraceae bacterium]|nr:hypothetical protein [Nitrospiraceae bacterium]